MSTLIVGPGGKLLVGPGGKLANNLDCCCGAGTGCPLDSVSVTVAFASINDCGCVPGSGTFHKSLIGNFTITCPNSAPGTWTATQSGGITWNVWNTDNTCSGSPDSTTTHNASVTVTCASDIIDVSITDATTTNECFSGGGVPPANPVTVSNIAACGFPAFDQNTGGTATVSW